MSEENIKNKTVQPCVLQGEAEWCGESCQGSAHCKDLSEQLAKVIIQKGNDFVDKCNGPSVVFGANTPATSNFDPINPLPTIGEYDGTELYSSITDSLVDHKAVYHNGASYRFLDSGAYATLRMIDLYTPSFTDISITNIPYATNMWKLKVINGNLYCAIEAENTDYFNVFGIIDTDELNYSTTTIETQLFTRGLVIEYETTYSDFYVDGSNIYWLGIEYPVNLVDGTVNCYLVKAEYTSAVANEVNPITIPLNTILKEINYMGRNRYIFSDYCDKIQLIYVDTTHLCLCINKRTFVGYDYTTQTLLWSRNIELPMPFNEPYKDSLGSAILDLENDCIRIPAVDGDNLTEFKFDINWRTDSAITIPTVSDRLPTVVPTQDITDDAFETYNGKISCYGNIICITDSGDICRNDLTTEPKGYLSDWNDTINKSAYSNLGIDTYNDGIMGIQLTASTTIAVCVNKYNSDTDGELYIVDITDMSSPTLLHTITHADGVKFGDNQYAAIYCSVRDNRLYVSITDGDSIYVSILDVANNYAVIDTYTFINTDPGAPSLINSPIYIPDDPNKVALVINQAIYIYNKSATIDVKDAIACIPLDLIKGFLIDLVSFVIGFDHSNNSMIVITEKYDPECDNYENTQLHFFEESREEQIGSIETYWSPYSPHHMDFARYSIL